MLSHLSVLLFLCVLLLVLDSLALLPVLNSIAFRSDPSPARRSRHLECCRARLTTLQHHLVNVSSKLLVLQLPCILIFFSNRLMFSDRIYCRPIVVVRKRHLECQKLSLCHAEDTDIDLSASHSYAFLRLSSRPEQSCAFYPDDTAGSSSSEAASFAAHGAAQLCRRHVIIFWLFVILALRISFLSFASLALRSRFHFRGFVVGSGICTLRADAAVSPITREHLKMRRISHDSQFLSLTHELRSLDRFAAADARVGIEGWRAARERARFCSGSMAVLSFHRIE
jgi:hypothetical protein